ncbi:MAG: hypothetical protein LBM02_09610 [Lachnospiraceae bacterium]|nr:hypothetical protein [Lachnospiraceae bacterium]
MEKDKNIIFKEILSETITDDDINEEYLKDLGVFIGLHPLCLREIYKSIQNGDKKYIYGNNLGSKLEILYAIEEKKIMIKHINNILTLNYSQFINFLGIIDMVYSEIYPLYTLVELDETMFSENLQKLFLGKKQALVVLTARKIALQGSYDKYVMDYFGRLWPYGELPDVAPILISNMMIKRVVSMGPSGESEKNFTRTNLKEVQIENHQISSAFMPSSLGQDYIKILQNKYY